LVNGKLALGHDGGYGIVFSSDGKHLAYPAGTRDEVRIIHDGKPGPAYHDVGTPVFSPDGQHLAYVASLGNKDSDKAMVVIDGQAGPVYDEIELPGGQGVSCFSPDGKHTAYAARKEDKWHAVVDGHEGPACDAFFGPGAITSYCRPAAFASWRSVTWHGEERFQYAPWYEHHGFQPLFFGPDGKHVAYVGIVQTQARVAVVVNNVPGPQYEQVGRPVVSDDGRRVAYVACRDKDGQRKVMAVIDGQEGPAYDEIPLNRGGEWEPFSRGGQHSAYKAREGLKWRAVVDGQPGPEYDEVYPIAPAAWYSFFSADGSRIAYLARRGEKWRAVIDGREGPEFDRFKGFLPLKFSPDGKRVAYIAQWGHGPPWKYLAIIDGREGPEYETKWIAGPIFSPDSKRVAYVGGRDGKEFVVLDGKELALHDDVDGIRLRFSPDSQRLAYIAYRGKYGTQKQKAYFVVDGQEGREHGDSIYHTYFSPNSKHAAYIAINGRWQDPSHTEQLVVDGSEGPVVDRIEDSSIRWSNDGKHLAYVAEEEKEWVVLDGKAQAKYGLISDMAFSPDGKHLAYMASDAGDVVVRDGRPGPIFDEIKWRPLWARRSLFTPDGRHILYRARRNGKRVVVLDDKPGPEYDAVAFSWLRLSGLSVRQRSRWPPRILPDGAIQYPALTTGNPAALYIVTQSPGAGSATPRH
jgi:Tol biopolymer transport system component